MQYAIFQQEEPTFNPEPESYREKWGLELPPKGTKVSLVFYSGGGWCISWNDCPDDEDLLYAWYTTRKKVVVLAEAHGWEIDN